MLISFYLKKLLGLSDEELSQRTIDFIDIVNDPLAEYRYKESEDPKLVTVLKPSPPRGPLSKSWKTDLRANSQPVMCSYKIVKAKFEVWGLQTKVEAWAQKVYSFCLSFINVMPMQ